MTHCRGGWGVSERSDWFLNSAHQEEELERTLTQSKTPANDREIQTVLLKDRKLVIVSVTGEQTHLLHLRFMIYTLDIVIICAGVTEEKVIFLHRSACYTAISSHQRLSCCFCLWVSLSCFLSLWHTSILLYHFNSMIIVHSMRIYS